MGVLERWSSPPDDVGYLHLDIVHYHRQVVSGVAAPPQQNEVLHRGVVEDDAATNEVANLGAAFGRTEADGVRLPFALALFQLGPGQLPAGTVVPDQPALALGLAGLLHLPGLAVAAISGAFPQQLARRRLVTLRPLGLAIRAVRPSHVRPLVPLKPQPEHVLDDAPDGLLGGTGVVGILDTQDEDPVVGPGQQVIVERGASAPDVQVSSRTRSEPQSQGHHTFLNRNK